MKSLLEPHEAENFAQHVATLSADGNTLDFARPRSSYYLLRYHLVTPATLVVVGDLGDAIYRWSEAVTFPWIANCSLDYFHGKAVASAGGRTGDWYDWDADQALKRCQEFLREQSDRVRRLGGLLVAACHNQAEFANALNSVGDYDLCEALGRCGNVIPIGCRLHLGALRLALQALPDRENDQTVVVTGSGNTVVRQSGTGNRVTL